MITIIKDRTNPEGVFTNFHTVGTLDVDKDGQRITVLGHSWATKAAHDALYSPSENWAVTVNFSEIAGLAGFRDAIIAHLMSSSDFSGGTVYEDTPGNQLQDAKIRKRQELTASWQSDTASGVTIGGKVAPTDSVSWTRYLALARMAEDTGWVDVPIPLSDGTFELLTQAKAGLLWTALKDKERTLLSKLKTKIELVQAATTIEEVNAISWNT